MRSFIGFFCFLACSLVGCLPPRGLSYSEFEKETFDEKIDFVNLKQAIDILKNGESSLEIELKRNECYQGRTINFEKEGVANLLEQKSCSDLALDTYINKLFILSDGELLEIICSAPYPKEGVDRLAEEISYINGTPVCPENISGYKVGPRYRRHSAESFSSDWTWLHPQD